MYKRILVLAIGIFNSLILVKSQDLSGFKWQKRVLLVFDNSVDTPSVFAQQKAVEKAHLKGFMERDLIVLKAEKATLFKQFNVKKDKKTVILIGKDGNPKVRQEVVFEASKLFKIVDAMPMRQDEIRRKN